MAAQANPKFPQRPKAKTPAERSVEFDAVQARLRAEAAERRESREAPARSKSRR
jgi:hypothetical protein